MTVPADPESRQPSMPLAIIGMGCLFPRADSLGAYWANIKAGVDAITDVPPTHWTPESYYDADPKRPDFTYGRRGGFLEPFPFDPLEYGMPPNALEATDTSQLLGMVAADRALRDAGYGPERDFDRDRVSVVLGVTGALELVIPLGARLGHPIWRKALQDAGVDPATTEDVVQRIGEGYVPWQENSFPGLLGNVVAGRITKHLNLGGTNCVVDAACASSLSATHLAAMELETGRADIVITGGVDTFNDIFMYMCFSKTPALSPTGNAKPFDAAGDGTILGEGLGMVVLKRLSDAERDGDRVYAVLLGVGASSDGKGDAIYAPSAKGQTKALKRAYAAAGIAPETVGLVEAHGTGTVAGDAAEVKALCEVYGAAPEGPWCALGSVKSQIGHTKAAAGAAGLIKATLSLYHKTLPPTIKVQQPQEPLADRTTPFYVNATKRPWVGQAGHPRRAAVSALGFGGSNFHCVLEEHRAKKTAPDWDGRVELVALCGASASEVREALTRLKLAAGAGWNAVRAEAAASREAFDSAAASRLLLVLAQAGDHGKLVDAAADRLAQQPDAGWSLPGGVFYGTGKADGKIAFVFSGQGAQYPNMLGDLACQFPAFLESLDAAELIFQARDGRRLSELVYPHAAFDDATRTAQADALRATDVAQPALGAVGAGVLAVLHSFGLTPEAVAGHSFGELVALHAAGMLDLAVLLALSAERGARMAACAGSGTGMMAVRTSAERAGQLIADLKLEAVVANHNAPVQVVLSGTEAALARAEAAFGEQKIVCTRLPVAAAFHSAHVADASEPLLAALKNVAVSVPKVPVYSNTTAGEYPAEPDSVRELLASQLARPVRFVEEVEAMYAAGVRTFLEVGPGARIAGLIGSILGARPHQAFAIDSSAGKRDGIEDLARVLGQAAALGHGVDLRPWNATWAEPAQQPVKGGKPRMTVALSGANHVAPRAARPAAEKKAAPAAVAATELKPVPAKETYVQQPIAAGPPVPAAAQPAPVQGPVSAALQMTQDSLVALQRLQEQTAQIHRQFLEGQQAALATFQTLLQQQHGLVLGGGVAVAPSVPAYAPLANAEPVLQKADAPTPPDTHTAPMPAPAAPVVQAEVETARVLLETVAEKTGYPVEMLDLDMALDADLGIDSIKRVEILSALRERLPDAPEITAQQLGTLHTLAQIVAHLGATSGHVQSVAQVTMAESPRPDVERILLETVAEKTGYPAEMLDLDMALDADLGIDSIKRVEILSALRERMPDSAEITPQHLGTLHTLRQIVEHLGVQAIAAPAELTVQSSSTVNVEEALLRTVAEKTGYPVEMLGLEMALDADLGIDSIKRVEIFSALRDELPSGPEVAPAQLAQLQTLQQIVDFFSAAAPLAPTVTSAAVPVIAAKATQERTIERLILTYAPLEGGLAAIHPIPAWDAPVWLAAEAEGLSDALELELRTRGWNVFRSLPGAEIQLQLPETLAGVILLAPAAGADDAFLLRAMQIAQHARGPMQNAPANRTPFFTTVSRVDGAFGLGDSKPGDALSGGLAGLTKTIQHEWERVQCRAVDLAQGQADAGAASAVLDTVGTGGPVEIGLSTEGAGWVQLCPDALPVSSSSARIGAGDVVVVTGGARGVTAEVAVALAERYRPTLVLLGRSEAPHAEEAWLAGLESPAEIKRSLAGRGDGGMTPRQLEEAFQAADSNREMLRNLERMRAAGATVQYHSVDVRDPQAVSAVLDGVRGAHGPVRGIVHGAGVLADRMIQDKTEEQFLRVYETKVLGLRALLAAAGEDPLRALVLFSSSTARYGRKGQVDYAMANEVLNKMAQAEARRRKDCRVVSLNWGPWEGGMVNDALAKVFKDEGVGLIDLELGARYLVDELEAEYTGVPPVEIVIFGGPIPAPEGRARSGADEKRTVTSTSAMHVHKAFDLEVSVEAMPCLRSHVLKGKAVAPVALLVEWLGHAALHANPGYRFLGLDDLRVFKGIAVDPEQTLLIEARTGDAAREGDSAKVPVSLWSGGVQHVSAQILLGAAFGAAPAHRLPANAGQDLAPGFYADGRLFHGAAFQCLSDASLPEPGRALGLSSGAPGPRAWIDKPLRGSWLAEPCALDAAFQLLILWTHAIYGNASLPTRLGEYRQYRAAFPKQGVRIDAQVRRHTEHQAVADITFLDLANGDVVATLHGYECTLDPALREAFALNLLPSPQLAERG